MLEFLKIVLIISYTFQFCSTIGCLYFDSTDKYDDYGGKTFKSKRQVIIALIPFGFLINIYEYYKKLK